MNSANAVVDQLQQECWLELIARTTSITRRNCKALNTYHDLVLRACERALQLSVLLGIKEPLGAAVLLANGGNLQSWQPPNINQSAKLNPNIKQASVYMYVRCSYSYPFPYSSGPTNLHITIYNFETLLGTAERSHCSNLRIG